MFARARLILATALAVFITVGVMPAQAFAAVVRTNYIVQTTAAGQSAVVNVLYGMGEIPLDQLDHIMDGFTVALTDSEAAILAANPNVLSVQPDSQMSLLDTETPAPSWGLDRIDQQSTTLDNTYNYPTDAGKGVRIYVVDTGVMASNPEFTGRILTGYDALGQNLQSNDCHGHGTHVAATAAGTKFGVAKQATIVPVRVLNCQGSGYASTILAGLDWIIANNPVGTPAVVSMSIGGGFQPALNAGMKKLYDDGILPVVAAGNSNDDACKYSPASAPEAFTVGATDITDARAYYSNYGDCVDAFAPGSNIISANASDPNGSISMSGTSMATPHVSGLAAMYLAQNPTATPAQVTQAIRDHGILNQVNNAQSQFGNILINDNFLRGAPPVTPNPNPVLNSPDAPTLASVDQIASTTANLTWTNGASDGGSPITGHMIKAISADYRFSVTMNIPGASVTSGTIKYLYANTSYSFSVATVNAVGVGIYSTPIVATTSVGVPTVPIYLSTAPAYSSAMLTWFEDNDGGSPITSYQIDLYSAATGKWSVAGTSATNQFNITGLNPGGTYMARVTATSALGNSLTSSSTSFTTNAAVPDAPTGLVASAIASNSATVSWNPVVSTSPDAPTTYVVTYGIANGSTVSHLTSSTASATLTGLLPGRNYVVSVHAQVGATSSVESSNLNFSSLATVPDAPTYVQLSGTAPNFSIKWQAPAEIGGSPLTGYLVQTSGPLVSATSPVSAWTTLSEVASTVNMVALPVAPTGKFVLYRVLAKNAIGLGVASATVATTSAPAKPSAPVGLAVTSPNTSGLISLTWSVPANDGGAPILSYTIVSTRDGVTWQNLATIAAGPNTATAYTLSKPLKGQTWSFEVYATNQSGNGVVSNSVSSTTPTTVSTAPASVAIAAGAGDQVTVRWSAPSDNGGTPITGYVIERQVAGVWSTVGQVAANVLTFTVTRGGNSVAAIFRVSAVNSVGTSVASNSVQLAITYSQASAPTNFTASINNSTVRADLAWAAPTDLGGGSVSFYFIQVSKDGGGSWTSIASTPGTNFAASVTPPAKGQTFLYRVYATTQFGVGVSTAPISLSVAATVPSQPIVQPITLGSNDQLTLRWLAPGDNGGSAILGYSVEQQQANGTWTQVAQLAANVLTYTATKPAPGVQVSYRVRSSNAVGFGQPSAVSNYRAPYTQATAPTGFTAVINQATKRVDVTLAPPANLGGAALTGYYVQASADGVNNWTNIASLASTATNISVNAPAKGASMSYRAIAVTAFGASLPTASVALTTPATAPAGVNSASVSLTATDQVTVRWSAPYDNGGSPLTGYLVEQLLSNSWTAVGQVASDVLNYSQARGLPGSISTFRVSAVNAIGVSNATAAFSIQVPYLQASAPTGFAAVYNSGTKSIDISYGAPTNLGGGSVGYYYLQSSADGGTTWLSPTVIAGNRLSVSIAAPAKGQTIALRIYASTQFGAGAVAGPITLAVATTVAAAPTALSAQTNPDGTIALHWSAPTDNGGTAILGYKVQRLAGSSWTDWLSVSGNSTSVSAARDLPGTAVTWRVLASNAVGLSSPSVSASYSIAPVKAGAVQNLVASAATNANQVALSYVAPANLGGAPLISYYVELSKDNGASWITLGTTSALSVIAAGPAKSVTWQYRVQASTAAGLGDPSNLVNYTGR